jgi:hypothetical protein
MLQCNPHQTRASTVKAQQGDKGNLRAKELDKEDPGKDQAPADPCSCSDNPLHIIEKALIQILEEKVKDLTRTHIKGVITFIREIEVNMKKKAEVLEAQAEVSAICKVIKHDLSGMYITLGLLDLLPASSLCLHLLVTLPLPLPCPPSRQRWLPLPPPCSQPTS